MNDSITIHLDEQPLAVPVGCTLERLLELQRRDARAVATARNGAFVAREARAATELLSGDRVLLFRAIVGG
jgi:sulfur carrier protein